jgi:hypothetical protein
MTDFFFLVIAMALAPFAIAGAVLIATPGPISRRIVHGVVAGVLSAIAASLLWPSLGHWLLPRSSPGSVLLWQEAQK